MGVGSFEAGRSSQADYHQSEEQSVAPAFQKSYILEEVQ
jgi:hypothetical protein